MEGEMEDHRAVTTIGREEMLLVIAFFIEGYTIPKVSLAGLFVNLVGDRRQDGQVEGHDSGATVGGDGARAGDGARRGGFLRADSEPVGLVRLTLTNLIVNLLRHVLGHEDGPFGCRTASAFVGGGHGVGGGLRRRRVDVRLCTARAPLVGQRSVILNRRNYETANGSYFMVGSTIVLCGNEK